MKPRHLPVRTCSGCRQEWPKRDMIRVVRAPDGSVSIDPTGKRNGRGTYVCPRAECWAKALRTGSLARGLKVSLGPEDRAELERASQQFGSPSSFEGGGRERGYLA